MKVQIISYTIVKQYRSTACEFNICILRQNIKTIITEDTALGNVNIICSNRDLKIWNNDIATGTRQQIAAYLLTQIWKDIHNLIHHKVP